MKIFVTGATGYIGGSIADRLIASGHQVVGLVRSAESITLLKDRGIESVVGNLDDPEIITKTAQQADAVIHAASADNAGAVVTLVGALERSGKTLICTTGSGIVVDSADGEYAGSLVYTEDIYFEPVPFRRPRVAMNRMVREAAIDKGIRSIVICPSMIYGKGRGLQPNSDQLPKLIALSKQVGAGVYFGKGLNRYSNVHIDDLVDLYLLALDKAPGGSFFFAENGNASFKEIAEMISRSFGLGKTVSLSVEELARQRGDAARYGMTSNSLVSAVNARRVGWSPKAPSLAQYFESLR
jgi:nucleoside-diphosphate-sugar epimerase